MEFLANNKVRKLEEITFLFNSYGSYSVSLATFLSLGRTWRLGIKKYTFRCGKSCKNHRFWAFYKVISVQFVCEQATGRI